MSPFKSAKQRKFLFAKHPEIAKRWAEEKPESKKREKKAKKRKHV